MTVSELHKHLSLLIRQGHADTRVIANCESTIDGEYYNDFCLSELGDVYYQSGDIELSFKSSFNTEG